MSDTLSFVLLDVTGGATPTDGEKLTPELLGQMAVLLTVYGNRDVASEYGGAVVVRAGADPTDIRTGEIPVRIGATLAQAPGAIAYHDVDTQGAPDVFDAITLSDSLFGPGNSLSVALSHELAETMADAGCNLVALAPDGTGYAREACDPVESSSYEIALMNGVAHAARGYVSNFVTPAYFVDGHPGPWDFMTSQGLGGSAPPGPFKIAPAGGGNYQIVYESVGSETQITASLVGSLPHARAARKMHPTSRTARRLAHQAPKAVETKPILEDDANALHAGTMEPSGDAPDAAPSLETLLLDD